MMISREETRSYIYTQSIYTASLKKALQWEDDLGTFNRHLERVNDPPVKTNMWKMNVIALLHPLINHVIKSLLSLDVDSEI